jgi:hypothetical protein
MRLLKRGLPATLAATALIAAGCGGDDDGDGGGEPLSADEYTTQITEILTPVGPELQEIGGEISELEDSQTDEIAAGLEETEGVLNDAISEIEGLEPPEDAADAQDQLVTAMEGFVSDTADFREAVLDGEAREQATAFQEAGLEFQTALTEAVASYQEAGIEVGSETPDE